MPTNFDRQQQQIRERISLIKARLYIPPEGRYSISGEGDLRKELITLQTLLVDDNHEKI